MKHISQVSVMKASSTDDFIETIKALVETAILDQAETLIDSLVSGLVKEPTA